MTEWPHLRKSGEWYDSAGTVFDYDIHAKPKNSNKPTVNKNGTFRKRPKPNKTETPLTNNDLAEANHLLGAFKAHVDRATTIERLDELKTQSAIMGFDTAESIAAEQWIEDKRKLVEAA